MRTMPTLTLRCNFCLLIIHAFLEGAQPAIRVQTAVRSERLAGAASGTGHGGGTTVLAVLLTCFQVHDFDFNFSFILIILLNLYSGNLNAFQK